MRVILHNSRSARGPGLLATIGLLLLWAAVPQRCPAAPVQTGAEQLLEQHLDELAGRRVGLVMNPTARIGPDHVLDRLLERRVQITALFAPEHGFRGEAGPGEHIIDGRDQASGLPVFSLYGASRRPTPAMLAQVDLLLFDMQDVGVRCYTYIATLGLVLQAAAQAEIPVWVLDRPNPLGGVYVSGWTLEEEFRSFVGPYPIPLAHGLTMGEMALMIAGEGWLDFERPPAVRVIPMRGWRRVMRWPDTGLDWVAPSPNLPTFDHAFLYAGTVFFEGTTLSEGRGTDDPFLVLGAPDTALSAADLAALAAIEGVRIRPHSFTPQSIPGVAPDPKHRDQTCQGIRVEIQSHDIDPIRTGLRLLQILYQATPSAQTKPILHRLSGTKQIDAILNGTLDPQTAPFDTDDFRTRRTPYLLY